MAVVVAGDVSINWLIHTGITWPRAGDSSAAQPAGSVPGWSLQPGTVVRVREGGALLLARLVRAALEDSPDLHPVLSYQPGDLDRLVPGETVSSYNLLDSFPAGPGEGTGSVIRVSRRHGFSGPTSPAGRRPEINDDTADARVVVLHDEANGFRHDSDLWPLAVREDSGEGIFVIRLGRTLADNPLLDHLRASRRDRTILLVDAEDLRADGISISRRLSWERTAKELVWQLQHNADLQRLADLPNIVVRLGLEGAIHYRHEGTTPTARLYYDPLLAEGGVRDVCRGEMVGSAEAFAAALVSRVVREGLIGIGEGIRDGIRSARRLLLAGFGHDPMNIDFPGADIFRPPGPGDPFIADASIPISQVANSADPDFWCILNELSRRGLEPLAHQILLGDERGLRAVPLGIFGNLRTVDRAEIESYSAIQSLITQYIAQREVRRPLCLAVFGPPGSGKSFGVEQVAKSVGQTAGARVEKLEFNMSQLESTKSLVSALHRVRDEVVKGRTPLVFFDEFDSHFGSPLGWLRYFLAPMQDGAFRDGDTVHPVGKAVFVFAGGLSDTFARFSRSELDSGLTEAERAQEVRRFREAKGPDFVSRLRGFVDVKGANPDAARPQDRFHLIRRAMIARSLLERNWSPLRNVSQPTSLNVEESVVRALIGIPAYKHGVRSLEAVLEMSMLDGRTEFDPSALPPPEQLEQHVDSRAFASLVLQGVLFAAAREAIAEAIHERYRRDNAKHKEPGAVVLSPWRELPEVYRRSNRAQAADVIRKLETIDCGYRPTANGGSSAFSFTKEEIERLAELEHERWMDEKLGTGYSFGPLRDDDRRTHPDLVAWSVLSEKARQYDRNTVAAIPEFLAEAGFEIYRM